MIRRTAAFWITSTTSGHLFAASLRPAVYLSWIIDGTVDPPDSACMMKAPSGAVKLALAGTSRMTPAALSMRNQSVGIW